MAECLSYKTGGLEVGGVLMPTCQAGCVLVQTACSLVSVGTRKHVLGMAKKEPGRQSSSLPRRAEVSDIPGQVLILDV